MHFVIQLCFVFVVPTLANQITVPVQQYPAFQQSVYNSPTVPVVYQPAASYSNPCAQYSIVQNQKPTQIANALVNKVLSNPTIHRILDPNSRLYNQNGVEYTKPTCNQAPVPNIINNYFIVPPEFLKLNESGLSNLVALPSLVSNGVNHNTVENVEILSQIPQTAFPTKENLVEINQDITNPQKNTQQNVPCRKVRRKKGRKRIRGKIVAPQRVIKEHLPDLTISDVQNKHENISNHENAKSAELLVNNQKSGNIELEVNSVTTEQTNHDSNPSNKDSTRKKKSKKRKRLESETNSANHSTVGVAGNENNQHSVTNLEIIPTMESDNKVSKVLTSHNANRNNDQTLPNAHRTELNEECFEDIGSLLTCLSETERVTRNSQDEAILRDLRQQFPNVPENLARDMLSFVQRHYNNHYHNHNCCSGLPFNYNQMYQMPYNMYNMGKSDTGLNIPSNKPRRRKGRNRKIRNKKRHNTSNTAAPKLDNLKLMNADAEDDPESTTASAEDLINDIISTTVNVRNQMEGITSDTPTTMLPDTEATEVFELKSEEILSDYDQHKNIESGEETQEHPEEEDFRYDKNEMSDLEEVTVPIIYTNRLIDDYYPTFTDNAFYANTNEYTLADLSDRYYYTTDRNMEIVGRDRRKLESFKEKIPPRFKQFGDVLPKHTYFDAERESYKHLIKDIIQPKSQFKYHSTPRIPQEKFKTPPGLENPDFITKKINKAPLNPEDYSIEDNFDDMVEYLDYGEKSSIYSNAKPIFRDGKAKHNPDAGIRLERPEKINVGEVETLYARSKVAKYGMESEDTSPEITTIKNIEDDQIYVVTAQSLGSPEEFW